MTCTGGRRNPPSHEVRVASVVGHSSLGSMSRVMPLAVLLLAAGCDLLNAPDYFPLGFRYSWEYQTTTRTEVRGVRDTSWTRTGELKVSVEASEDVQGQDGWRVSSAIGAETTECYWVNLSDRLLRYDSPTDAQPETVLRFPFDSAVMWTADSSPDSGKFSSFVQGKGYVKVPVGDYDSAWCVRQTYENLPGCTLRVWYADGVGRLKSVLKELVLAPDETTRATTTIELTDYKLE